MVLNKKIVDKKTLKQAFGLRGYRVGNVLEDCFVINDIESDIDINIANEGHWIQFRILYKDIDNVSTLYELKNLLILSDRILGFRFSLDNDEVYAVEDIKNHRLDISEVIDQCDHMIASLLKFDILLTNTHTKNLILTDEMIDRFLTNYDTENINPSIA